MRQYQQAVLKSLAGLSINISAAYFGLVFIGTTVAFPKNFYQVVVLIFYILSAIVFLGFSIIFEKELEKYE